MTITADTMKDKLLTVDAAREVLASTEPLVEVAYPVGHGIRFKLDPEWNADVTVAGTDLIPATVKVGNGPNAQEFQLTKDAALEATSICGIPKEYAWRTPAKLVQDQLNYWHRGGLAGREYKILANEDTALAVTRSTIQPFSNLRLLDEALVGIEDQYGKGEVLVDNKFTHDLRRTHLRLIVPEQSRVIKNTGTDDDEWSLGLQIRNSLIGEKQTEINGYLFRWWCTNGAIDTRNTSGTWSRRGGQGDEVYEWARSAVDEILGGLEHSFDAVQALTEVEIDGSVNDVLRDVFEQYGVPVKHRSAIIEQMVEADQLNMYSVMQAITRVANDPDLPAADVNRLLLVGGDLVHTAQDRCDGCHRLIQHTH